MAEKVLMMKLTVDLECSKCYKKVKKALRKFPQITDEFFDEKSNTVIIKVVCYNPEKLMNKLCYKGDGSIKSIVILEPPKPPPAQPQPSRKPKDPAPAPAPASAPAPALAPAPAPVPEKPKPAPTPAPAPVPAPVPAPAPAPQLVPMWQPYHCGPYYEAQQYQCYGRPIYDSWGCGRHCCHEVANQQSCSIM